MPNSDTIEFIPQPLAAPAWWRDVAELAKLRLNAMVLLTVALGYLLAGQGFFEPAVFVHVLAGTALAAIGSSILNQYLERDIDRLMQRTAHRPLPAGRIAPSTALLAGAAVLMAGLIELVLFVNPLSAALCAVTIGSYLFVYTPLKRISPVSTLVGAVPGAIPPVIGWAAVDGRLGAGAWALFFILFMWQLPHFFAISWIYRDDYRRAGLPMMSMLDVSGERLAQHMSMCILNLIFASLVPVALHLAGGLYFFGALAAGLGFLFFALMFWKRRSIARARGVLFASLVYLPMVLGAWLLDVS